MYAQSTSQRLDRIERKIDLVLTALQVERKLIMANTANLSDLDKALDEQDNDLVSLTQALQSNNTLIQSLNAKVGAGQDVSAELTRLQNNNNAILQAVSAIGASDSSQQQGSSTEAPPA